MLRAALRLVGASGRNYCVISPLGASQTPRRVRNVWSATDGDDTDMKFVVKQPSEDDDEDQNWPRFHHEVEMLKCFNESVYIRRMVDQVPASDTISRPVMVLEAFEQTLRDARNTRELSTNEIKRIMKSVLMALRAIHRKGLVYSDLKMESVLLDGFEHRDPGDWRWIITRLGDCGMITEPGNREITSLIYRSPEVYFGKPFDMSSDIWSWGIMYCHLLEAQADLGSPGLFEDITAVTLDEKAKAIQETMAEVFLLHDMPFYADDEDICNMLPIQRSEDQGEYWWGERLMQKGVCSEDMEFLYEVLNPNPLARWTAEDIIDSGYLEIRGDD